MLYSRVFLQILDSSLADDWKTRHVFEDMLKLANRDGVVDMTQSAIARRTNVPPEIVRESIAKLESPDPNSRDPDEDGRRLVRLDPHRDWGWRITNWHKYVGIRVQAELREFNARRMANYRAKKASPHTPLKEKNTVQVPTTIDVDIEGRDTCSQPVVLQPQQTKGWNGGGGGDEWATSWLEDVRKNGADYTDGEMKHALLALKANGFKWGQADPRAALERQIQCDRRREQPSKSRPGPEQNQMQENIEIRRL